MRLLLDTHILIWFNDPRRDLGAIDAAIRVEADDVYVRAATIWEVAIKKAKGKLADTVATVDSIAALGFDLLPITGRHAEIAGDLPLHHADPFDRMLIAQAQCEL